MEERTGEGEKVEKRWEREREKTETWRKGKERGKGSKVVIKR